MPTISESKKGKIKELARLGKEPKWIDWTID